MIGCNYKLGSANWREVKSSVLAETLVGGCPSSSSSFYLVFYFNNPLRFVPLGMTFDLLWVLA